MSALCRFCGRPIERANRDGTPRVHCSKRCARTRVGPRERRWETAVLELLAVREDTACPSEVARAEGGEAWRDRMEDVRRAARRLAARGEVEVLQGGRVVDAATARGPIRLRLASREANR